MKKQIMTALAVSAMMTLAMPFASFAASRSCQTGFRLGNNCGYTTGTNAISMVRTQGGCVISNGNAIGLGIAHCQVASIAKEVTRRPVEMLKAQTAILTQHAVEDGIYTKSGKLTLNNKGYKPNVTDRTNSETLYNLMDTSKVTDGLKGKSYNL